MVMVQRLRLSWQQKQQIIDECERRNISGGKTDLGEVSKGAQNRLALVKALNYKSMLRIVREKEKIRLRAESILKDYEKSPVLPSAYIEHTLFS